MTFSKNFLIGLALVSLAGCGGGTANIPEEAVTPPAAPAAKAMLTDVANSGELGSGASMIREALEAMKATDAAKVEPLLKEMTELEGMSDPAKIKAKAKAMADKL